MRAFRLLTLLCFLWCGLGIAEPAVAHAETAAQHETLGAGHWDGESGDASVEGGHHHCPVAPEPPLGTAPAEPLQVALMLFVPVASRLGSLTHAPPLQPPAA